MGTTHGLVSREGSECGWIHQHGRTFFFSTNGDPCRDPDNGEPSGTCYDDRRVLGAYAGWSPVSVRGVKGLGTTRGLVSREGSDCGGIHQHGRTFFVITNGDPRRDMDNRERSGTRYDDRRVLDVEVFVISGLNEANDSTDLFSSRSQALQYVSALLTIRTDVVTIRVSIRFRVKVRVKVGGGIGRGTGVA